MAEADIAHEIGGLRQENRTLKANLAEKNEQLAAIKSQLKERDESLRHLRKGSAERYGTTPGPDVKHLTVGQLLAVLDRCDPNALVRFDFEYCRPNGRVGSYRGSYERMAIGFTNDDVAVNSQVPRPPEVKVKDLERAIRETKTMEGYKGGTFPVTPDTLLHVANYGNTGDTIVCGVIDNGYQVIIVTAYEEV